MTSLLAQVLPFALAAAVSPTVLTIELLILSGRVRPKSRAWAFVLGFTVVLVAVVVAMLLLLHRAPDANGGAPSPWARAIDGIAAALLVVVGVRQLITRPTSGEKHQGKVAQRMQDGGFGFYVGVGALAMLTNASTLVMLIPATHTITKAADPLDVKALAALFLVLVVLLPLLLPALAVTVVGQRSDPVLASLNGFVTRHQRVINATVCFLLAALIGWKAFA